MKLDDELREKTPSNEEIALKQISEYNDARKSISDYAVGKALMDDGSIELIKHDFISTKTVSMWYACAGLGKSTFVYQEAMLLAQNQSAFGLEPTQPVKSLIFQWEDTDKKIWKLVNGIQREYGWTTETMESIRDLVIIPSKKLLVGKSMMEVLSIIESAVRLDKPHIVWLNPITAFFDGNISSAQEVTILRKEIDRIAETYNVHFALIHHIGKQMKNTKDGKRFTELDMYDGIGSSIFPNWCRSMIAMHPTNATLQSDPDKQLYCLSITKNQYELGWRDKDDKRTSVRYMSYGDPNICWIDHGFDAVSPKEIKEEKIDVDKSSMIVRLKMGKDKAISITQLCEQFGRSRDWVKDRLNEIKSEAPLISYPEGKSNMYYIETEVF